MIRKAKPGDLEAITALGIEALEMDAYDNLVISQTKVRDVARHTISAPNDFVWVSVKDDVIVGVFVANIREMLFYERRQASVLMFYCHEAGDGAKLIRKFLKWARSRAIVKLIEFTLEPTVDPRVGKLLHRMGLNVSLPVYIELR